MSGRESAHGGTSAASWAASRAASWAASWAATVAGLDNGSRMDPRCTHPSTHHHHPPSSAIKRRTPPPDIQLQDTAAFLPVGPTTSACCLARCCLARWAASTAWACHPYVRRACGWAGRLGWDEATRREHPSPNPSSSPATSLQYSTVRTIPVGPAGRARANDDSAVTEAGLVAAPSPSPSPYPTPIPAAGWDLSCISINGCDAAQHPQAHHRHRIPACKYVCMYLRAVLYVVPVYTAEVHKLYQIISRARPWRLDLDDFTSIYPYSHTPASARMPLRYQTWTYEYLMTPCPCLPGGIRRCLTPSRGLDERSPA